MRDTMSKMSDAVSSTVVTRLGAVAATVVAAAIVGGFAYIVENESWKGAAATQLNGSELLKADVSTSLAVLGDHGTELQLIRVQIEGVRGQLAATRLELLESIKVASGDRFRSTDWEREEEVLVLKFDTLRQRLKNLESAVAAIQDKLNKDSK